MRLILAAVGRLKAGPERELAERYRARAEQGGRALGFKSVEIVEVDESRARRASERMSAEARLLLAAVPKDAAKVLLDPAGKPLTSETFAQRLTRWRDDGRPAVGFMIGGADGLGAEVRADAALSLSFGAATWPHQLVRVMLLEQVYRAVTILAGHPYHRG
ncbi:MAG TPA: 23S rRNA (pseudouridine(1915)-N(3))-methyltransferase RlmH [Xanthobacteraceae bacterium]|nr:23S rRNA (pseudouridine(1915)-N(3))-methyltransferase RlmH [Xanthobacteraceae bacterium]